MALAEAVEAQPQSSATGGMAAELRVEWDVHRTEPRPLIRGYVNNAGGTTAARVTVLVEGLDGAGQSVNSTVGYVFGVVPAFNRTYFEVHVPPAVNYRVSVLSYDWIKGGGGGM